MNSKKAGFCKLSFDEEKTNLSNRQMLTVISKDGRKRQNRFMTGQDIFCIHYGRAEFFCFLCVVWGKSEDALRFCGYAPFPTQTDIGSASSATNSRDGYRLRCTANL